jgi:uncharacterized phage protein gp47/JayE
MEVVTMSFERKSAEHIVTDMVTWMKGCTTKLTDFRVGSKTRTILEAVAIVIEERTDKLFRSIRELIETNIYAIFSFDKIPATYATGTVTFSRVDIADQNYIVLAGTTIVSQASQYNVPLKYYVSKDVIIATGTTSVDVGVVCATAGSIGNISGGSLTGFLQKPVGVDSVTNNLDFITGSEEETSEAQKARFQEFLQAQSRGVLQSIEYGAKLSNVVDTNTGLVTEKVVLAVASEDLINKLGQVDLHIWNGAGTASAELKASVSKSLSGYYDADNNPVYGFKPAGILVNIYSAPIKYVKIKLTVTPETWATLEDLKPLIVAEASRYFSKLKQGQTVIQTALEANLKYVNGISDIKLSISIDSGATYSMSNVQLGTTEIAVLQTPIIYE